MNPPTAGYTLAGAATGTTQPLPVIATQASLTNDFLMLYSGSSATTGAINLSNLLGISSAVTGVSDAQTLRNKTLDNTNSATLKDSALMLQSSGDATKQVLFSLSAITAGQTRTITLPDRTGTLATLGGTETFTNKTITNPTTTQIVNTNGLSTDTLTTSGNAVIGGTLSTSAALTIMGQTAPPAGGLATTGLKLSSTNNFGVFFGSGAPTLNAAQGSLYLRTDGTSTTTRAYINTNGASTWTALTTGA